MFTFERSVTINKLPRDVFAFVANPMNIPAWRKDVLEIKASRLPLSRGDHFDELVNFMGKKSFDMEVTDIVQDQKLQFTARSGPAALPTQTLSFSAVGDATQFSIHVSVVTVGFFKIMEPLFPGMFAKKWEGYLVALKNILEKK